MVLYGAHNAVVVEAGSSYIQYASSSQTGNYIAVLERKNKIIEVVAATSHEAESKSKEYFSKRYGGDAHVVILPVPTRIGVLI